LSGTLTQLDAHLAVSSRGLEGWAVP